MALDIYPFAFLQAVARTFGACFSNSALIQDCRLDSKQLSESKGTLLPFRALSTFETETMAISRWGFEEEDCPSIGAAGKYNPADSLSFPLQIYLPSLPLSIWDRVFGLKCVLEGPKVRCEICLACPLEQCFKETACSKTLGCR
jgi:hypothetical protein